MSAIHELESFIKSSKDRRLIILCVGNILRGDDGLGPIIYKKIKAYTGKTVSIFNVEQSLENFLPLLSKKRVTHCLIIDSVRISEEDVPPGTTGFFKVSDLANEQISLSTHYLPMKTLVSMMEKKSGAKIRILGIQPQSLDFDTELTPAVKNAIDNIEKFLVPLLQHLN